MPAYRLRPAFRILAWIPALAFFLMGLGFAIAGFRAYELSLWSVAAVLLGTLIAIVGLLFGKMAWTGWVSAALEEYGVDDLEDLEQMRTSARTQGRFKE